MSDEATPTKFLHCKFCNKTLVILNKGKVAKKTVCVCEDCLENYINNVMKLIENKHKPDYSDLFGDLFGGKYGR